MNKNYQNLLKLGIQSQTLRSVNSVLSWDQETYMPQDGADARSSQLELMASLLHKSETSKSFVTALSKLIDIDSGKIIDKTLTPEQKASVKEYRRHYQLLAKLPNKFVKEFAKLTSQAMHVWIVAKKENAFNKFAPYLERIIDMSREKAELLGYKKHPYDALLDEYEPEMTTAQVTTLFSDLRKPISALVKKIVAKKAPDTSFLQGNFSHDTQVEAGIHFLKAMGYDFNRGRLDISAHPFSTTFHPTDSRVTTRLDPHNFMNNIGSCLHEGGHALYEQGLPAEHFGSPLCEAISLGVHESQSRFWETRIGQSKVFWEAHLPYLKKTFKGPLEKVSLEDFYKAINLVEPGFIRVDADEVTYSLHVILRFELEKALIEGSLKTRDIPDAWNAKMKEYLGITPKTNSQGCLQDVHWSMGGFGYFPTYTLGNLYATHIFQGFEKAHPDYEKRIAKGELLFIKEWLHENIHKHGKRYSSLEIIEKAAGKPFTAQGYIDYLEKKYGQIYSLKS